MNYIRIEPNKSFYGEVELEQPSMVVDGQEVAQPSMTIGGTFAIADGVPRLNLVKFDQHFHVSDGVPLTMRTEENWVVSLFDTVPLRTGRRGGPVSLTYYQHVISNLTLVSWEQWKPEYRVRRATFRVPLADYILRHWPTYQQLADSKLGHHVAREAIVAPIAGGTVRIHYSLSGSGDSDYPKEVWPLIEMEFDTGLDLNEAGHSVLTFVRFLSAVSSVVLEASELQFSQLTHAEYNQAHIDGHMPIEYSVYYQREVGPSKADPEHIRTWGAFAFLNDDAERDAFVACLTAWFGRSDDYEGATLTMMEAMSLKGQINPTRLINATKWIEATPGVKPKSAMKDLDITALSSLLARNAIKLGYSNIRGRIANCFKQIASEANSARFIRLVAELKLVYGEKVVGDDLASWVAEAFTVRGSVAHGPIIRQTELQYQIFVRATYAAECFAYLLLLRDLPMSDEGRIRVGSAAMVEKYGHGIRGQSPVDFKKAFKAAE
ncbi:hypothetical protein QP179_03315 [Sphingomonas aurantiaca]|uniref:hypothetical protein n=1 Tax=Sphingomonas aurantiaca TaxID=185949 RepID=UPI002FE20DB5